MDLFYNCYGDRDQSEALFSNILTQTYDNKVEITDLELLCQRFALKFLTVHIVQIIRQIRVIN